MDTGSAVPVRASAVAQLLPAVHGPTAQPAAGVVSSQLSAHLAGDTKHPAAALQPEPAAAAQPAAREPHHPQKRPRPSATNEWDRMPAEIQHMILATAGPFTKFVNGMLVAAELRGLSAKQRERLWQDAIDVDWQGDLHLLLHANIASKSLSFHNRRLFERAMGRFRIEDVTQVIIRNGWMDMLDFSGSGIVAPAAAREGALDLLEDLFDVKQIVRPSRELLVMRCF
ncbi:hypothetical protein HK105_206861 [Polyrhizophydium stewartii]|uniref:Uncharacterized protein n=1 Tax=Polyrhizophydium stewartii TaxID=2732419 RepID=A0ABR4N2E7_9FUNG